MTMKIDINKKYRTRSNKEVTHLHRTPEGWPTMYPWRGLVDGCTESWTDDGRNSADDDGESEDDLIEVREPREWVMHVKPGTQKVAAIYEEGGEPASDPWECIRVREIID